MTYARLNRERNKVLARKTRVKKKAQMETMRDQVMELMEKNEKLRAILTKHAPESVNLVKVESHRLPDNILALVQQQLLLNQRNEINMLTLEQSSFCVVSATHTDSPIIYASPAFYSLTGYSKEQVVGHNCRFLQGPETDRSEVSKLTSAIVNRTDFKTVLLNYCKDGSTFYNKIQITHLQGEDGVAPFIIGLQSRVSSIMCYTI
ncbi:PAS domain-containing protein [Ochromonadaceae sp. CCMP2298]|nr:PAS domain-containing protein [Ochromonadaceae sp. CCMP2298]